MSAPSPRRAPRETCSGRRAAHSDWLRDTAGGTGKVGDRDLGLLHLTDDGDEVVALVAEAYQAWQDTH